MSYRRDDGPSQKSMAADKYLFFQINNFEFYGLEVECLRSALAQITQRFSCACKTKPSERHRKLIDSHIHETASRLLVLNFVLYF